LICSTTIIGDPNLPTLPSLISLSFTDHSVRPLSQIPPSASPPLSHIPLPWVRQLTTNIHVMVVDLSAPFKALPPNSLSSSAFRAG